MGRFVKPVSHGRLGRALRRAVAHGGARWTGRLPREWIEKFQLDGGAIVPLRVEIGGGEFPSPGYVHLDASAMSSHLEYLARADDLPFAPGAVEELLAIHVLEHVHPADTDRTLREWLRVLAPGGMAQIHVPNAATVLPAFLNAPLEKKLRIVEAIFGVTDPPGTTPDRLMVLELHKVIFDFELLEHALLEAGFVRVEDVSLTTTDRHMAPWEEAGLVAGISLIVRGYAGR